MSIRIKTLGGYGLNDTEAAKIVPQTLTEEQQAQARANIGAVSNWSDLPDKPVQMVGGDTLTWDGNTEGLVSAGDDVDGYIYKISDATPTITDVSGGLIFKDASDNMPSRVSFAEAVSGLLIDNSYTCWIVHEGAVGVDLDGMIIPEAGFYINTASLGGAEYPVSLTIPGYTGFAQEKIAPTHLYQPDWNQSDETKPDYVRNRPFGVVYGDMLTCDMAILSEAELATADFWVKLSDDVLTQADFANGMTVTVSNGEESESVTVLAEECQAWFNEDGSAMMLDGWLFVVPTDNYTYENITIAEAGLYVQYLGPVQLSITIPGQTGLAVIQTLDEAYIPASIARTSNIVQADWAETDEDSKAFIKNKPKTYFLDFLLENGVFYVADTNGEKLTLAGLKEIVDTHGLERVLMQHGSDAYSSIIYCNASGIEYGGMVGYGIVTIMRRNLKNGEPVQEFLDLYTAEYTPTETTTTE